MLNIRRVHDAGDLADKMQYVIEMTAGERDRMGAASRKKMGIKFDERIVIEQYWLAIKNIIRGGLIV